MDREERCRYGGTAGFDGERRSVTGMPAVRAMTRVAAGPRGGETGRSPDAPPPGSPGEAARWFSRVTENNTNRANLIKTVTLTNTARGP